MRRGGTHFWQAPTALDLPPPGGGGVSAQEAPTHSPTDQHKGKKIRHLGRREYSPSPQNHQPTLGPPVWSLFELLSGGDKQTCRIKTKASSVVP